MEHLVWVLILNSKKLVSEDALIFQGKHKNVYQQSMYACFTFFF